MSREKILTQLPLGGAVVESEAGLDQKPKSEQLVAMVPSEAILKKVQRLRKRRDKLTGHPRKLLTRRIYYLLNPDKCRKWERENPDRVKAISGRWYRNHKEQTRENTYRNRRKNPEKTKASVRKWHREHAKERLEYRKKFRRTHPEFVIADRVRRRMNKELKHQGARKGGRSFELIGCSPAYLRSYIESLFKPGMTWANRHLWHIDHKRPLASFTLMEVEQQKIAFHFTNLQPLWAKENREKSDKLPPHIAARIIDRQ